MPFTNAVNVAVSVGTRASSCACVICPALTRAVELGLLGGDERRDEARYRLAGRGAGDLGERLSRLDLREQVCSGQPEVRRRGVELVAVSAAGPCPPGPPGPKPP